MSHDINLRTPIKVIGGNNTVVYQGTSILGFVYKVKSAVAITAAMGVVLDAATATLNSDTSYTSTAAISDLLLSGRPCNTTGSYNKGWLGVALESGAAGDEILVAGPGSITYAQTDVAGALGQHVLAHATADGSVTANAAVGANPINALGYVMKPGGTTGGATDTGSGTRLCVMVLPHAAVS